MLIYLLIFQVVHSLLISVDDTGLGIDSEYIERIYDNGFSTKGESRGTGLCVVKEIVDKYSGNISVESEKDTGTSFIVFLKNERSEGYV
ncbi:MAG: GHKL domain-containing protein [Clostridiales bacterium]|nr:GHKL domain-containing protein [Clostridiales bacterium]